MIRLAKEVRLVGGDRIDEMDRLTLKAVLFEEVLTIAREALHADRSHAAAQPAFDHALLRRRHLDAAVLMNKSRQPLEITRIEMVDGFHGHDSLHGNENARRARRFQATACCGALAVSTLSVANRRGRSNRMTKRASRWPTPRM